MKLRRWIQAALLVPMAAATAQTYMLHVDTLHVGDGSVLTPGYIYWRADSIVAVSNAPLPHLSPDSSYRVRGHAYPGFIAMSTLLGLVEIGAVRATRDYAERGRFNPNVRPIVAYNTDSKIIPTTRSNGVLVAQIRPAGGVLAGKTSVAYLHGRTWEHAMLRPEYGQYLYWPVRYRRTGWWAQPGRLQENKKWQSQVEEIYAFFHRARAYASGEVPPHRRNPRYEALRGLFQRREPVFIQADYPEDIASAIHFADSFGLRMVLVSGRGLGSVLDMVAERRIPVVLQSPHTLPLGVDDAVDSWYRMPAELHRRGIPFAIAINDVWDGAWQQRNLPFVVGTAVAYGLPYEAAVASITAAPARILGLDDRLGTLRPGKEATFIVSSGDALDIASNHVVWAVVKGRRIGLDNHHRRLYRRYRAVYGLPPGRE